MKPATQIRAWREIRLLVQGEAENHPDRPTKSPAVSPWRVRPLSDLPSLLKKNDLLVLNDSATLPATLHTADGLEIRLMGRKRAGRGAAPAGESWHALTLGKGDWRSPTEHRGFPRRLELSERLTFGQPKEQALEASVEEISAMSESWITLKFKEEGAVFLEALFAQGKPIQYSYLETEAPLYQMQTPIAARPWSVEMPSAARALSWELLTELHSCGVEVARLTHGCGISSSGDPRIDRALPLEEPYEIPSATWSAIARAKKRGGRVVAVGTSVVRALESGESRRDGLQWTGLRLSAESRLKVVDGILTGLHESGESHFELLQAFLPRHALEQGLTLAEEYALLQHELGDCMLVFRNSNEHPSRPEKIRRTKAENRGPGLAPQRAR